MKRSIFWIFGLLQSVSLGLIVFLMFRALNQINTASVIGADTQVLLSVAFPFFLLMVEYTIYTR